MKRTEVLKRLGFETPSSNEIRVIIHTDANNEADDAFAIVHHLLTPISDIRGIIAGHYEGRFVQAKSTITDKQFYSEEGRSMLLSYQEIEKILTICEIEDVPIYKGCERVLEDIEEVIDSEGVNFIIEEAMRDDSRPLYLAMLGNITDFASALNKKPEIAGRLTPIWIGGESYPDGGTEFNIMQDVKAAQKVFATDVNLWQIPASTYGKVEITLADLALHVRPCGSVGEYLFTSLLKRNQEFSKYPHPMRKGENWCLGDSPTVAVLLESAAKGNFHIQNAPRICDDMTYEASSAGHNIRVYDEIDSRFLLNDFYAKLKLCYGAKE